MDGPSVSAVDIPIGVDAEVTTMYERVLFPTDGSDAAEAATEHALAIASRFDVPLHALYVVDVRAAQATDAYAGPSVDPPMDALEAAGEEAVERVGDRAEREGVAVTTAVVEGTPTSAIVEAAADGDVVVMGTHGRTGLDRYLIGSTTEKVVRTADVPVVTVPVSDSDDSRADS